MSIKTKRNETNLRENNWEKYISSLVNDITSLFQVKLAGFPHTEFLKCMPSNLDWQQRLSVYLRLTASWDHLSLLIIFNSKYKYRGGQIVTITQRKHTKGTRNMIFWVLYLKYHESKPVRNFYSTRAGDISIIILREKKSFGLFFPPKRNLRI